MIEAGHSAPDFTLPDQEGNKISLADLRGETVVLYFYLAPIRPAVVSRPLRP